jgi:VWFA-related protein
MFCGARLPGSTSIWVIDCDLQSPAATLFRGYFLAAGFLAASLASAATAQENAATFRSGVNVVQVPVVVRDAHGHAVGNLTQGDFEVFDKGKRQTISSFSVIQRSANSNSSSTQQTQQQSIPASDSGSREVSGAEATHGPEMAAAKIQQQRHIIYVFDDLNVSFTAMAGVRAAALQYFKTHFQATDWAAIHTFSGRTSLTFTNDHTKLEEAVTKLQFRQGIWEHAVSPCPDVSYYLAKLILNAGDQRALDAVAIQTVECAHVIRPIAEQMVKAASARVLAVGEQDIYIALQTVKNAIALLAGMPGERLIVLTSSGFFAQTPRGIRTTAEILDLAARNNVIINVLDARGIVMLGQMDAMHERERSKQEMEYYGQREQANSDVLAELAGSSGGRYFHNDDLKAGFARLTEPPEFSYVLGFTPTSMKTDGSFHALKIRLPGQKGLSLQARRGYYALAPESPEEMARMEMHELVFSRQERRDLATSFKLQTSKSQSGDSKLRVITKLDPKGLHFEKIDGRSCDSVTIVAALFDTEGGYVAGVTKTVNLRLSDESLAQMSGGINVPADFAVKPGIYLARVVVREANGGATSAQNGAVPIL